LLSVVILFPLRSVLPACVGPFAGLEIVPFIAVMEGYATPRLGVTLIV